MAIQLDSPVRKAGVGQGLTLVTAAFLPIVAIVSLTVSVPTLVEHFRADPNVGLKAPVIVSAPGLTIALLAMFAGVLVDRFGRRNLLIAATGVYALIGVAPFFLENIDQIIASRLLLGVTEALILTIVNTLIGDYWDQDGRRFWLTVQGIVGPFFATGVIRLSGPLTELRWNGVFLIYLIAVPIFLAMLVFIYEPKKTRAAPAAALDAKPAAAIKARSTFPLLHVITVGIVTLAASSLYYVFVISGGMVFQEIGVTSPNAMSAIISLASLFVMAGALVFWLLAKRAPGLQIGVFLAFIGAGMAGMGLVHDAKSMFWVLILQQIGAGMAVPTLIAWAQRNLPFEHRGRGMGVWTSAFFLGQFSSPFLVNGLKALTGSVQGAFLVLGVISVLGAAVSIASLARRAPKTHLVAV